MTKILVYKNDPWINRAIALSVTRKKKPIEEIIKECEMAGVEECKKYVQRIVRAPADNPPGKGFGHRIGIEFGDTLLIINPSRFEALRIWREANALNGIRISGLERSLRIQKPPFECIDRESKYLHDLALPVYEEFVKKGIAEEDARFLLPEGVKTTIILDASANRVRDLAKLANSLGDFPLKEEDELKSSLLERVIEEIGFVPNERSLSEWPFEMSFEWWKKKVKYGKGNKQISSPLFSCMLDLDLDGSLSMYAQAVRLRQGLVMIEPVTSIARRRKFEVPPSFGEGERKEYYRIAKEACDIQEAKLEELDATYVYSLLLGQKARGKFYVNAAHAPYIVMQRACGAAQWEIRSKLGIPLYEKLKEEENVGPRCMVIGECWEPQTSRCPLAREPWRYRERKQVVEKLRVSSQEFDVP